jgi:hypothetical protein
MNRQLQLDSHMICIWLVTCVYGDLLHDITHKSRCEIISVNIPNSSKLTLLSRRRSRAPLRHILAPHEAHIALYSNLAVKGRLGLW